MRADKIFAVLWGVFTALSLGGRELMHNWEEARPVATWIGTALMAVAFGIGSVPLAYGIRRWLRKRGYALDDEED